MSYSCGAGDGASCRCASMLTYVGIVILSGSFPLPLTPALSFVFTCAPQKVQLECQLADYLARCGVRPCSSSARRCYGMYLLLNVKYGTSWQERTSDLEVLQAAQSPHGFAMPQVLVTAALYSQHCRTRLEYDTEPSSRPSAAPMLPCCQCCLSAVFSKRCSAGSCRMLQPDTADMTATTEIYLTVCT